MPLPLLASHRKLGPKHAEHAGDGFIVMASQSLQR